MAAALPCVLVQPARVPWHERLTAALLGAACLAMLVLGASLEPSPTGYGTHEQLGFPPCGWLAATGRPCPTCGMTTAVAAAAHGRWGEAIRAQPFAAAMALAAAVVFWGAVHVAVFGSRIGRVGARLLRPRWVWAVAAAWALSWAYKIGTWGR